MSTVCLVSLAASSAFAQGGGAASSLAGVVADAGGGVLPGATVTVKNNATAVTTTAVTNSAGAFSVPALDPGKYTVSVSLSGFKTVVLNDVTLLAATPASVNVTLEIGSLSETVEVRGGGSELVQTQTPTVATTIQVDQINKLPLPTRNALNYVTFLPGVATTGVNRDSTISGLPQGTINITLDGVNVQDNYLRTTDGFFARTTPRQDAVEQVTVTTAGQGANAAGQGAVQIQFVTRSGTNQYKGTGYHYFRHPSLNSNYWFNDRNGLDKNRVILNQVGASEGGPIHIPGLFDGRGRAFFFFNYEEFRQPTERTFTRTILNPLAQQGIYRYQTASGIREANLLSIAQAAGESVDPTIAATLARIQAATETTGVITDTGDLNTLSYRFQSPADQLERQPTTRLDFNINPQHRLSGTYIWQQVVRDPDFLNSGNATFPGFSNFTYYDSYRPTTSIALRSTLSSNVVNELRFGAAWGASSFGLGNIVPEQFADTGGFAYSWGNAMLGLTSPHVNRNPSARDGYNWNIDNTLNWQKGAHSLSLGGSFSRFNSYVDSRLTVPLLAFEVDTNNDPIRTRFATSNPMFAGASTGNITNARRLYALLTGRVTSIGGDIRLNEATNEYDYLGLRTQRGQLNEFGFFLQDSWRVSPTLTLNGGVRWQLQLPFSALNDVFSMARLDDICGISGLGDGPGGRGCNLFNPQASGGKLPEYVRYDRGNPGYNTDYNNFAPNVGVAWRPNVQGGFLRTLLGDPEQATLRAGFSVAYNRQGMEDFMGVYASNPGSAITTTRNANNGNLVLPGETWPVFLRDTDRLGPPAFNRTPSFPIAATISNSVNILHPDLEVPYARSYTVGFQRSLGRDTAVEVRYVGTRNLKGWTEENWNELNIFENNFLEEFKLAQANLRANLAAGRGGSFAYFGPNSGTSPLPTYLAYFSGRTDAANAAAYTSSNFANSAWTGHLGQYEPDALDAANDLHGSATLRANALAAGLTPNHFRMNPNASSANVTVSASGSRYNSMQMEVRRRFADGLFLNANYTLAYRQGTSLPTLRQERVFVDSAGTPRHAFKLAWTYEVPVGRGRRFGTNMNAWLNGVLGNWEFSGTGRIQSGNRLNVANARLVGMTQSELQDLYEIRIEGSGRDSIVYMLPDDVILNTRRAYDTDPTSATGYSSLGVPEGRYIAPASMPGCVRVYPTDCGEPRQITLTGPMFTRFDFSLKKTFPIRGRVSAQLEFDVLNVFDNVNFTPAFNPGSGATIFQVNAGYQDLSNTFDPGGRLGQIVWRINW